MNCHTARTKLIGSPALPHLLLVAIFLLVAWSLPARAGQAPIARRGVIDLRAWDPGSDGILALDGEWRFEWGVLAEPQPVSGRVGRPPPQGTGAPAAFLTVPGSWTGTPGPTGPLPRDGYATYRLRILLPPSTELLALYIPYARTAYRLWIDGRLAAANGTVGTSRAASRPQYRSTVARFTPVGPVADVVVHVSNFHHREGGLWRGLRFGTAAQIEQLAERKLFRDVLLASCALIIALYHLVLFALRRDERPALWLGLFALGMAGRFLVVGDAIVLTRLLPNFSWDVQLKIEYLALYLGVPWFVLFAASLFPAEASRRVTQAAIVLGALFSAVVVLTPVRVFSLTYRPYAVITLLAVIWVITVIARAARRRREGASLLLRGVALFFLTACNDLAFYANLVRTTDLTPVGLCCFMLLQSFVLARRAAHAFSREASLRAENARLLATVRRQLDELHESRRLIAAAEDAQRQQWAEFLHG
ncbi:MAG TPA: 7TM-DISM domain-containing protein, partial [Limnochordia bacterium]